MDRAGGEWCREGRCESIRSFLTVHEVMTKIQHLRTATSAVHVVGWWWWSSVMETGFKGGGSYAVAHWGFSFNDG